MRTRPWLVPPDELVLGPDDVHVWRADLAVDEAAVPALHGVLASDEREHAARFRLARERRRFVVARARLRATLARYLGREARGLGFVPGPGGKPRLTGGLGGGLEFNLSHSGECALLAVSRARRLGVDVEQIRPDFNWAGIAAQLFTARQLTRLATLSDEQRAAACFRRWTRAEAWLKARGEGLAAAALQRPAHEDAWLVRSLHVGPGYAAAVAAEGHGWTLTCFTSEGARVTAPY